MKRIPYQLVNIQADNKIGYNDLIDNNNRLASYNYDYNYNNTTSRYFALCESCFWSASLLNCIIYGSDDIFLYSMNCPVCDKKMVSLIPLTRKESFNIRTDPMRGMEIEFSLIK